jgi:hypothetical protein
MCFSATASFGAAAVLGSIGAISLTKAKKPSHKMFAAIPLVFGIQQACEGFLWLALTKDSFEVWQMPATYCFLFFAQILWPTWMPVSILLLEQDVKRKRWLKWMSLGGVFCSLVMSYRIVTFAVNAEIQNHHILYNVDNSVALVVISSALYFLSTVAAAFSSSVRYMKLLGSLSFGSLIISKLFYKMYFISVWCFFAAILSIVVIYIIKNIHSIDTLPDSYKWRNKHYSA